MEASREKHTEDKGQATPRKKVKHNCTLRPCKFTHGERDHGRTCAVTLQESRSCSANASLGTAAKMLPEMPTFHTGGPGFQSWSSFQCQLLGLTPTLLDSSDSSSTWVPATQGDTRIQLIAGFSLA